MAEGLGLALPGWQRAAHISGRVPNPAEWFRESVRFLHRYPEVLRDGA